MGAVYRARDTRLGREVALKVLPEAVAGDGDRLARFEREARTLAALNHPNIAQIYGFEETSGSQALIMELVEGEDLSTLIARARGEDPRLRSDGAPGLQPRGTPAGSEDPALHSEGIPVADTLPIARQIALALEAAHEQGIIHRDLKPANVKIKSDGVVKVLDFGLAKALETGVDGPGADADNSPTIASPAETRMGMILGTPAYMAPEQAKGRPADRRGDLWAFGCVLYEMLTGMRPFPGDGISETLASVLKTEPNWDALPAATPPAVRHLLTRCLEKDRARRLDSAAAARIWIEDAAIGHDAAVVAPPPPARSRRGWWAALALATTAAAVFAGLWIRERQAVAVPVETRTDIVTPRTSTPLSFAISPDGRQVVFTAAGDGAERLWLRRLDSIEAKPLDGTDAAMYPFWSPDSRSIAFFSQGWLKRLDLSGGQPRSLSEAAGPRGGTWGSSSTDSVRALDHERPQPDRCVRRRTDAGDNTRTAEQPPVSLVSA